MYTITKDWKEFNISLDKIDEWGRTNLGASFSGISADNNLRFDFTEEPSNEVKAALNAMWDGIEDDTHEYATSYFSFSEYESALSAAKEDAVTKSYDELSAIQKKLLLGVALTLAEKLALVQA